MPAVRAAAASHARMGTHRSSYRPLTYCRCSAPAQLQCPKCVELGLAKSPYCSQDCFKVCSSIVMQRSQSCSHQYWHTRAVALAARDHLQQQQQLHQQQPPGPLCMDHTCSGRVPDNVHGPGQVHTILQCLLVHRASRCWQHCVCHTHPTSSRVSMVTSRVTQSHPDPLHTLLTHLSQPPPVPTHRRHGRSTSASTTQQQQRRGCTAHTGGAGVVPRCRPSTTLGRCAPHA